jgi:DNA-directed RNA polymerase specialized sigma24 family protein
MASAKSAPDLREFIKEHDQKLYDFCFYMLDGGYLAEEAILATFHDFSAVYRRLTSRRAEWDAKEARIQLFQSAWARIREALVRVQYSWTVGRDTRVLKANDEDILGLWLGPKGEVSGIETAVVDRLGRVDADFRSPVVLRDILGFSDEEVVQILGVRWGVFRHRLHRGRLELKDGLRGKMPGAPEARTR